MEIADSYGAGGLVAGQGGGRSCRSGGLGCYWIGVDMELVVWTCTFIGLTGLDRGSTERL